MFGHWYSQYQYVKQNFCRFKILHLVGDRPAFAAIEEYWYSMTFSARVSLFLGNKSVWNIQISTFIEIRSDQIWRKTDYCHHIWTRAIHSFSKMFKSTAIYAINHFPSYNSFPHSENVTILTIFPWKMFWATFLSSSDQTLTAMICHTLNTGAKHPQSFHRKEVLLG